MSPDANKDLIDLITQLGDSEMHMSRLNDLVANVRSVLTPRLGCLPNTSSVLCSRLVLRMCPSSTNLETTVNTMGELKEQIKKNSEDNQSRQKRLDSLVPRASISQVIQEAVMMEQQVCRRAREHVREQLLAWPEF